MIASRSMAVIGRVINDQAARRVASLWPPCGSAWLGLTASQALRHAPPPDGHSETTRATWSLMTRPSCRESASAINESGAEAELRRRCSIESNQAVNELLLPPGVVWVGLNSLARPLSTSVLTTMSCRPCLRCVHATIRKPMHKIKALRYLAG